MALSLEQVKQDAEQLCGLLGVDRPGHTKPCVFCGSSDAMSVKQDNETRNWTFKCFSCGIKGDIVTAVEKIERLTPAEAIKKLCGETRYKPPVRQTTAPQKRPETIYATLDKLKSSIAFIAGERGLTLTAHYDYDTLQVFRLEGNGKKQFVQAQKCEGGFKYGAPKGLTPLFCLADVVKDNEVVICEGEKTALALRKYHINATTSAGGSKAPQKTDWSPLAGKTITIWPDDDEPGEQYASDVIGFLSKLYPRPIVRLLDPTPLNLGPGGDAADLVKRLEAEPEYGETDILALLRNAMSGSKRVGDVGDLEAELDDAVAGRRKNIKTGWHFFDTLINGLIPEGILLFGGPPGSTKSFAALQWVRGWVAKGIRTNVLLLENSPSLALRRALGQICGNGQVTYDDWCQEHPDTLRAYKFAAQNELDRLEGIFESFPDSTAPTCKACLQWLEEKYASGVRVAVIDPITAMHTVGNTWDDHKAFIWKAKELSERYRASLVIVTHPSGRPGNNRFFTIEDMSGGKAFQRFSQSVVFISPQNPKDMGLDTVNGPDVRPINRVIQVMKSNLGRAPFGTQLGLWFNNETLMLEERGVINDEDDE